MAYYNTDYSLYGDLGSNLGLSSFGTYGLGGGSYLGQLGYSSYVPSFGASAPAGLKGFLETAFPELDLSGRTSGSFSQELRDLYSQFRQDPSDYAGFTSGLVNREEIQKLLARSELQGAETFLDAGEGAMDLQSAVATLLGQEGSQLANLYGGTGVGAEQVAEDIRRLLGGQQSAIGGLLGTEFFGQQGKTTEQSRLAVAAQLLGGAGGPISLGSGQAFNPFSDYLLTDEYQLGAGRAGALQGQGLLALTGGLLSTQDLDITQAIQSGLRTAVDTGAARTYGGSRGYRLHEALAGMHGVGALGEGQVIAQNDANFRQWIDQWYAGQAGGGWGRNLPSWISGHIS